MLSETPLNSNYPDSKLEDMTLDQGSLTSGVQEPDYYISRTPPVLKLISDISLY